MSALREHLPYFGLLLLAVPPVSFLVIKVLLATRTSSKQKIAKQWQVSPDLDENGRPFYFDPDADNLNVAVKAAQWAGSQPFRAGAVKRAGQKYVA
ncbi:MAG: hypothetical protein WAM85_07905 [Terracidiphilus sp.]